MPSIGHGIFHAAKKWHSRGRKLAEICGVYQYQGSDGNCFFTTDGHPLEFGVDITLSANQFFTIDDDLPIVTTDGQPLIYGA